MTLTKERPIIFSAPMVQALLAGRKTMTRRVVKCLGGTRRGDRWAGPANPACGRLIYRDGGAWADDPHYVAPIAKSPYGVPGDRLWVRESWQAPALKKVYYRATDEVPSEIACKWGSPIHMPRWASRITLEITEVHVERVQEIKLPDVAAEGISPDCEDGWDTTHGFRDLWDKLNAPRGFDWESNPWVWVVGFKRIDPSTESAVTA